MITVFCAGVSILIYYTYYTYNYTYQPDRPADAGLSSFLARFARVALIWHFSHATPAITHLLEISFFALSSFLAPRRSFHSYATGERLLSLYETVSPVSRHFPAFGHRRTLITPLVPSPGTPSLFNAGAPLSHR
ncbi:hypothetical protein Y032_0342g3037 [Ancylostoma ceylanicum]|uniref:Uncharacterized protein n=1 Tax=Ancylostoma ceylanicum TaxID=53326 RepID=A0A016RXM0_9BILA|nr:hypothetical protein Y032_0342g3037 [Ancylostoma ceylanicum]